MGVFNGKLGPVIAYNWKGRPCLRSRADAIRKTHSKRQTDARKIFGATSALASNMKEAIKIGLHNKASRYQVAETNMFITLNRSCIVIVDDNVKVDYASLRLADGFLPSALFGQPQVEDRLTIIVDFTNNPLTKSDNSDYIYLYAYDPELSAGTLSLPVHRSNGNVSLTLPTAMANHTVHLYAFAWNHKSQASPSTYLGSVIV